MRVVTLMPAATEIVAALGGAGHLVGISHECDYPRFVAHLPRVSTTRVHPDAPSSAIDAEVRSLTESGRPVIALAVEQLLRLRPDLIVTQDVCEVCAVSDGQIHRVAETLKGTQVLALRARSLEGIWSDVRAVGAALDLDDEADELVLGLQNRLDRLRRDRLATRPRVVCLEWLDPAYIAGHWVPEMVEYAGAWISQHSPGPTRCGETGSSSSGSNPI